MLEKDQCWGSQHGDSKPGTRRRWTMHIRLVRDTDSNESSRDGMIVSQRIFRLNRDWPCILMLVYANDKESFKSRGPGKPVCPVQA